MISAVLLKKRKHKKMSIPLEKLSYRQLQKRCYELNIRKYVGKGMNTARLRKMVQKVENPQLYDNNLKRNPFIPI